MQCNTQLPTKSNQRINLNFCLTIDYVEEIFSTMTEAIQNENLKDAIDDLKKQTPPPMHTMLDKQSREEAIAKRKARDSMTCADIPPTDPGNKQYSKRIKCQFTMFIYYTQY